MTTCRDVEPLVTAYLDGEGVGPDRALVEQHLDACPPCRDRAQAESAARVVLKARASSLVRSCAPAGLHARCAASARASGVPAAGGRSWSRRLAPVAIAAGVVLAVALAIVFISGRSTTVLAAQLALDHVKCFEVVGEPTGDVDQVERSLEERYGWHMELPPPSAAEGLELLTARRCFYADGGVAHVLYRLRGTPVSLYVVPDHRASGVVEVMGHEAVVWSADERAYLLIARRPRREIEELANYVRVHAR